MGSVLRDVRLAIVCLSVVVVDRARLHADVRVIDYSTSGTVPTAGFTDAGAAAQPTSGNNSASTTGGSATTSGAAGTSSGSSAQSSATAGAGKF